VRRNAKLKALFAVDTISTRRRRNRAWREALKREIAAAAGPSGPVLVPATLAADPAGSGRWQDRSASVGIDRAGRALSSAAAVLVLIASPWPSVRAPIGLASSMVIRA